MLLYLRTSTNVIQSKVLLQFSIKYLSLVFSGGKITPYNYNEARSYVMVIIYYIGVQH